MSKSATIAMARRTMRPRQRCARGASRGMAESVEPIRCVRNDSGARRQAATISFLGSVLRRSSFIRQSTPTMSPGESAIHTFSPCRTSLESTR